MDQISLKILDFDQDIPFTTVPFTTYPRAKDCLRNLSELSCASCVDSEFFRQMSRICHHLRSLQIIVEKVISDGLEELISNQQSLKNLRISSYSNSSYSNSSSLSRIFPSITKLPNDLIRLYVFDGTRYTPLPFISKFTNLQELELFIYYQVDEYFKTLQYVTFSRLQTLNLYKESPNHKHLIKLLEINGEFKKDFPSS